MALFRRFSPVFSDAMSENGSSLRLIDQRIRNRIMEQLLTLADGDAGVREVGFKNFFEDFYDYIPHHTEKRFRNADGLPTIPENSAITAEENAVLVEVLRVVDDACDATPGRMSDDKFIATGWPTRIQSVARRALSIMLERGRFSEDNEEPEPSDRSGWPWRD